MEAGKEFQRTRIEQTKLGQLELVKEWLQNDMGWKPDEWTMKKLPTGRWIKMSPKFTDTSMKPLGELGIKINTYYTLRNRISILTSWIEASKNGRIHGGMFTIGTPSFRCRHSVIVNLPSVEAKFGRELRELFVADEGWKIVGADSAGNQLRGLCHYVNNQEFTDEVINGDQHQRNADALSLVVKDTTRSTAKSFLYAYLFGAGDSKLGQVLTGKSNSSIGKKARDAFSSSIKGLEEAKNRFEREFNKTKHQKTGGWFHGLDGRPVFVGSEHQCLNYALQTVEGITCKAAVSYQMQKIEEENLRAKPRIFYHDETAWTAHPDDAERVGEIIRDSFREAPKWFGVECMDGGDYVIGESYADVH
jgi:DNA polymerase I-like protein with 3'-5' exonuclease and polymerase domains